MSKSNVWIDLKESLKETIQANGMLLTIVACAMIVITGVAVINNPSNWWVSALAVLGFSIVVFLFMNARVIIKSVISILVAIILSTFAFQISVSSIGYNTSGVMWMLSMLLSYTGLLTYSYMTNSGVSRWGVITFSNIIMFISVFIALSASVPLMLSCLIGLVISTVFFVFFYKFTKKTKVKNRKVPENIFTPKVTKALIAGAEEAGWNITLINNRKEGTGDFLIWKDRAYLLHPIALENKFTNVGKKHVSLGYKGKSINPWLLSLAFSNAPLWRSRGAEINVVLLDLKNKNNSSPKVIGASVPDSKRKIPVSVFPARLIYGEDPAKIGKMIDKIDDEMGGYTNDLNARQKKALSRIGKRGKVVSEDVEIIDEGVDKK